MCPAFGLMRPSMYLSPFAAGASSGPTFPDWSRPVTMTPVTPRRCGSGPQEPSAFWLVLRNAMALSTIGAHSSDDGPALDAGREATRNAPKTARTPTVRRRVFMADDLLWVIVADEVAKQL